MDVISAPVEMQRWVSAQRVSGRSIGFVPTMGALHAGHTTLLDESRQSNDVSVLSIFVNPLQFNVPSDFDKYPRETESDLALAKRHGVDCVFLPSERDMYGDNASVRVLAGSAALGMEGEMRPGHFDGVTTIVAKLFHCVLPDRAYFGKKDYQQLAVVRQMVKDLDFPVDVVGVDTVREPDGLAMSSRNVRLSATARAEAVVLYEALSTALRAHTKGCHHSEELVDLVLTTVAESSIARVEYVSIVDRIDLQPVEDTIDGAVLCLAAWFDDVRLIDNVELPECQR